MLISFELRYGPYKDVHEKWMEEYLSGAQDVDSLLRGDWCEGIGGSGDSGLVSLQMLKLHVSSFSTREQQETALENVAQRIGKTSRVTKSIEEKLGRIKRHAKQDRSARNFTSADSVSTQHDWLSIKTMFEVEDLGAELKPVEAERRYLYKRAIDLKRKRRMKIRNEKDAKSKKIDKAGNSWSSKEEQDYWKREALKKAQRQEEGEDSSESESEEEESEIEDDEPEFQKHPNAVTQERKYVRLVEERANFGYVLTFLKLKFSHRENFRQ